jgi:dTDP-4-dehydrorhamnose 3,5-epimerase-like enzyme
MKLIDLPVHKNSDGLLTVMESGKEIPFVITRVFIVKANGGESRGNHAHKICSQFLVCTNGSILVRCTDGTIEYEFLLDSPTIGLLVPRGIWSQQFYLQADTVLAVLCDRGYEAEDYIRDYAEYLEYTETLHTKQQ